MSFDFWWVRYSWTISSTQFVCHRIDCEKFQASESLLCRRHLSFQFSSIRGKLYFFCCWFYSAVCTCFYLHLNPNNSFSCRFRCLFVQILSMNVYFFFCCCTRKSAHNFYRLIATDLFIFCRFCFDLNINYWISCNSRFNECEYNFYRKFFCIQHNFQLGKYAFFPSIDFLFFHFFCQRIIFSCSRQWIVKQLREKKRKKKIVAMNKMFCFHRLTH